MKKIIIIDQSYNQFTIRRFLRTQWPHLSQDRIHKSLRKGDILINNKKANIDQIIYEHDALSIWDKLLIEPENHIAHKTQFEFLKPFLIDRLDNMWVFNKPYGLAVQSGTNVKISLDFLLSGWMSEYDCQPYLVHRLDKNTSGIYLVATNSKASYELGSLFANRQIKKKYVALCHNYSPTQFTRGETGKFKEDINGKKALTEYKVLGLLRNNETKQHMLLMEFTPITGRKHQIRQHCLMHSIPIFGDKTYYMHENDINNQPMHLHALQIACEIDTGLIKPFCYRAPLPKHMEQFSNFIEI